jgi:hypothetical protein
LFDFFSGRVKTRIYTTFLGWILVLHIDIIFIAFLTDQTILFEKTHQLKGEYIWSYVMNLEEWALPLEITRLLLAAGITYLMIWVVPKLLNERSYREELSVEYVLRQMRIDKDESLNKREEKVVKQQLENIKSEKKVAIERAKLDETPEQLRWDSEFNDFIKIRNAKKTLQEIKNTVYGEGGNLFQYTDAAGWAREPSGVTADNLALADTNDLIVFADKGKLLALTAKGKYFIKRLGGI